MSFSKHIGQDWMSNKGNTKGRLITLLFRTGFMLNSRKWLWLASIPYNFFYKLVVEWILGIELPCTTIVGSGLIIYHGQATVIHKNVVFGSNCSLRHSTTIGNASIDGNCPVLGNNVDVGCNVCIIGSLKIGDNVTIGAGTVITKDIPSNCVVVGNPARVIKVLMPL